jgi:hypothetical protein
MNTQLKIYSPDVTERAIVILRKRGFYPKVVGYGPTPSQPRYEKGWLIDPVQEVHPYAKSAVEALRANGTPIAGYIMAHELEFLATEEPKNTNFKIESENILPAVAVGASILGTVLVAIAAGLIYALSNFDPSFICVIPEADGSFVWLELVNWRE